MFWRKRKQEKEPRLEPFVKFDVKYEPLTNEQIDAYLERQKLWGYLNDRAASYRAGHSHRNYPDDPFYDTLREFDKVLEDFDAEFHRINEEFERPIREMEAELAKMGVPKLGDIKVEDGIVYMVTGVTAKYGVRHVYDP